MLKQERDKHQVGMILFSTISLYAVTLSLYSRLSVFSKLEAFPPQRLVCFGICTHSNHTQMRDKRSGMRSSRKGGLGLLPVEPWCVLFFFAVRMQSTQPTVTTH